MLFVFLYGAGFQDQAFLSPAWMKNPLRMGYLRAERQASGLKINVCLILNATFLTVAGKTKNHPPELWFCVGSQILAEAASLVSSPLTSQMGA